ncbi:Tryptophan--tRNA ligase [bioreactor metagenome]|uniref:tryptophan--tRNA ligase n=1 Tax=bioreactor metagenome TaxID=1076179 RepID=A0A644W3A0_9ZZZZ
MLLVFLYNRLKLMEIVVSGIRPTGNLHLGNYFGALKNFINMQNEHHCYFFIADYHSLTTHPTPQDLHGNVKQVLVEYLAAGLDPEKATLYIQSDVPETAELYLFLNMNAYIGELERCTSFKDKIRQQPQNVNAGLLTYPTLMAADIIIHRATKVPVGKDQEQHLEMTRQFSNRFNRMYNVEYFPEPQAFNFGQNLVKIPGLNGTGKMGKSEGEGNAIFLADEPEAIRKKVMKAVTDGGPTVPNQEKPEVIQNIFQLMSVVSSKETYDYFDEMYNTCQIRYGDMKKQLAVDMIQFTEPFREKIKELLSDEAYISKVARMGKEKARESAAKTIREVREIIGFKSF